MNILAIDLGKFKSVACLFKSETHEAEYETIPTHRWAIQQLLEQRQPDRVVIETCSVSGWVHDLCQELGYVIEVVNPAQDAWKWKHVKRKTDKDDALKLSRLSALGQICPVYVPAAETRQYRSLVKYRKTLVGRVNRIQNHIRALFDQQGISIPGGKKAWSVAGIETLSQYRKTLGECDLAELWKGELDLELTALDALWEQLHQVEAKLTELAKSEA